MFIDDSAANIETARRLVTRAQRAASPSGGASFLSEADYLLGIRDDMRQGALRLQTEPAGDLNTTGPELLAQGLISRT